jgi:hypothetical protein
MRSYLDKPANRHSKAFSLFNNTDSRSFIVPGTYGVPGGNTAISDAYRLAAELS